MHYYIGSKRNNGGDGYLGWDLYNHATLAMIFSIARKKLFVHGNTNRNWYNNNNGESLISFYSKIHKDKGELLDFLATKKEEISSQDQLQETMKFLKEQLRGTNKAKAQEVHSSIMEVVDKRINSIDRLAIIQPVKAYKFYLQFKEIFRTDRAFTGSLEGKFKTLFATQEDSRIAPPGQRS